MPKNPTYLCKTGATLLFCTDRLKGIFTIFTFSFFKCTIKYQSLLAFEDFFYLSPFSIKIKKLKISNVQIFTIRIKISIRNSCNHKQNIYTAKKE